jgi:hypothetical protein
MFKAFSALQERPASHPIPGKKPGVLLLLLYLNFL